VELLSATQILFHSQIAYPKHTSAFPRRVAPESCRVRGWHPQPRVQSVESTRVSSPRVQPRSPGIPCAMVLTAYCALFPATNSFCHRHRRIKGFVEPGRADITSADLTSATDARTTRLRRPQQRRSSAHLVIAHRLKARPAIPARAQRCRVHRIPFPTSVTIASRPSFSGTRRRG
jgi:hypothetical protein